MSWERSHGAYCASCSAKTMKDELKGKLGTEPPGSLVLTSRASSALKGTSTPVWYFTFPKTFHIWKAKLNLHEEGVNPSGIYQNGREGERASDVGDTVCMMSRDSGHWMAGAGWAAQISSKLPGDEAERTHRAHITFLSPPSKSLQIWVTCLFCLLPWSLHSETMLRLRMVSDCSAVSSSAVYVTALQHECNVAVQTLKKGAISGSGSRLQVQAVFIKMSSAGANWTWTLIYRVAAFSQWPFILKSFQSLECKNRDSVFVFVVEEFEVKWLYCWPALRHRRTAGGLKAMASSKLLPKPSSSAKAFREVAVQVLKMDS